jgi:hypothetical protein
LRQADRGDSTVKWSDDGSNLQNHKGVVGGCESGRAGWRIWRLGGEESGGSRRKRSALMEGSCKRICNYPSNSDASSLMQLLASYKNPDHPRQRKDEARRFISRSSPLNTHRALRTFRGSIPSSPETFERHVCRHPAALHRCLVCLLTLHSVLPLLWLCLIQNNACLWSGRSSTMPNSKDMERAVHEVRKAVCNKHEE